MSTESGTDVRVVSVVDPDRAAEVVGRHPYLEWEWLTDRARAGAFELEPVLRTARGDDGQFVVVERAEALVGLAHVALLPWDTEVLGVACARARLWWRPGVTCEEFSRWLARVRDVAWQQGAQLLDVKADGRALDFALAF